MGRKTILEKRLARLQGKIAELTQRSQAADITVEELRSIQSKIVEIREDAQDVQDELDCMNGGEPNDPDDPDDPDVEGRDGGGFWRNQVPQNAQTRGGNPMAAYAIGNGQDQTHTRQNEVPYSSMEYRVAFKNYVQRGISIPDDVMERARTAANELNKRAGGDPGPTVTADIGAIIPETIMNEFIKDVSKVYGHIYSKVRKLNVKGGVKFPISKLKATFKWITETTVSGDQKAGDIKDFIQFDYNIGEIRVTETLLAQVVSLDLFESEITRIMVEAYVETMDKVIMSGTGQGQPLGIINDERVKNVVTFTAEELADWTAWRKKLFAIVPLSKRGQGEFLFPASTVETYLLTMKDKNDRPLFKEATELNMGNTAGSFFGRTTDLVEPDVIQDFDTANEGDVIGVFWVPKDYAINTNMQFGMKRWFDDDKNEWVNKGLTIVDGKILDTSGCYLLKKAASAPSA